MVVAIAWRSSREPARVALYDLAILTKGAVTVPIYPTLSVEQAAYILRDSEVRLAVASTAAQVAKLQAAAVLAPGLTTVVCMDPRPRHRPGQILAMADVVTAGTGGSSMVGRRQDLPRRGPGRGAR